MGRERERRESARDFLDLQDPQPQILSKLLASLSQKLTTLFRSLPSNFKMILKADYVDERVVWVVGERRELKRLPVTHFLEMHKHKLAVGLSSYQAGVGMRLVT